MAIKDKYLTISDAAKELGVTRQTISRWIRSGNVSAEKVGREMLIEKDELGRLYDEKMFEQFSEAMSRWIRGAILDYLQEKHYVAEDSVLVVIGQSRKHIKIQGRGEDGIYKVFDIPIKQLELVVDTKAKRLFRIKTVKVITRPLHEQSVEKTK